MNPRMPVLPLLGLLSLPLLAASTPVDQLLDQFQAQGAATFSAQRGEALWNRDAGGRRCTVCHTANPRAAGSHQKTGKLIEPIAPSANAKRLTEIKTINKWLLRNCKWTLGRECTAQEKGDLLTWLRQQ